MRLLFIAEDPAYTVGGISRYAVPVAAELARRGHSVDYLYSGGFSGHYDWRFRRRWETEAQDGVGYHRLVNPRSIGIHMGHPELDVACDDSRWIAERAESVQPDVIHIHSLLGIPFETIPRLAALAPVVFSFHDYGLICQRRVLLQPGGKVSETYADQSDCAWCVDAVDPKRYRLQARLRRTPWSAAIRLVHAFERISGRDLSMTREKSGVPASPADAAAPYRRRLAAGIGAVNANAARVIAVSRAVRDVLVRAGVANELVHVMHIGSGSADQLTRLPLPSANNGGKVTFLYLGQLGGHKGVHVLIDAAARLDPPPRVIVTGESYDRPYGEKMRRLAPASVEFSGPYGASDLPRLLGEADVVVAPVITPDTSPQVVLEALAAGRPVVGSRIGGIPDFVTDGVNGRLFAAGDAAELARIMDEMMDPALVARLASEARNHKRVDQHVEELETLYADLG
jgi:glycosyltransferase involved in cell wall biosynthesis